MWGLANAFDGVARAGLGDGEEGHVRALQVVATFVLYYGQCELELFDVPAEARLDKPRSDRTQLCSCSLSPAWYMWKYSPQPRDGAISLLHWPRRRRRPSPPLPPPPPPPPRLVDRCPTATLLTLASNHTQWLRISQLSRVVPLPCLRSSHRPWRLAARHRRCRRTPARPSPRHPFPCAIRVR